MDTGLSGRTALVTGASRGIGFAIASALVAEGVRVAICARDKANLVAAADRLGGGDNVLPVVGDVTDPSSVDAMVAEAHSWHGSLNIVVNNAGPRMQSGAIAATPDDPWVDTFMTKAMGAIRVSRAALPLLADDGSGRIITITGVTTKTIIPNAGITGVTNAALTAFTRYLAAEAAPRRILVNAVCPGMTLTEGWYERAEAAAQAQSITSDQFFAGMAERLGIISGRWAETAEIANVVTFLASDQASYMTAQMLVVDGGITAHSPLG